MVEGFWWSALVGACTVAGIALVIYVIRTGGRW